jgi:predicted thioesterase
MSAERPLPQEGATGTVELVVGDDDLASRLVFDPHDAYPAVFATTRMIALMEVAASRVLKPLLRPGELSVGVTVDVRHSAATPRGATVRASARFLGLKGKLYAFEVRAEDEGGEIGRGTHERAIVEVARLLAGAADRGRPTSRSS